MHPLCVVRAGGGAHGLPYDAIEHDVLEDLRFLILVQLSIRESRAPEEKGLRRDAGPPHQCGHNLTGGPTVVHTIPQELRNERGACRGDNEGQLGLRSVDHGRHMLPRRTFQPAGPQLITGCNNFDKLCECKALGLPRRNDIQRVNRRSRGVHQIAELLDVLAPQEDVGQWHLGLVPRQRMVIGAGLRLGTATSPATGLGALALAASSSPANELGQELDQGLASALVTLVGGCRQCRPGLGPGRHLDQLILQTRAPLDFFNSRRRAQGLGPGLGLGQQHVHVGRRSERDGKRFADGTGDAYATSKRMAPAGDLDRRWPRQCRAQYGHLANAT